MKGADDLRRVFERARGIIERRGGVRVNVGRGAANASLSDGAAGDGCSG